MSERRKSERQKSLLRGIVYFDNSPCATECLVRDISESGARLKFSSPPLGVTDLLELQIPLKALKKECKIVRRADDEVGVAFLDVNGLQVKNDDSIAERMSRLEAEIAVLKQVIKRLQTDNKNIADVA